MTPEQRAFEIMYSEIGKTYGTRDTYRTMLADPKNVYVAKLIAAIAAGIATDRVEVATRGRPS